MDVSERDSLFKIIQSLDIGEKLTMKDLAEYYETGDSEIDNSNVEVNEWREE